jgi:4-hydroxybenzoyl-CoA thioesterase
MRYEREQRVRFSHCDPAGIVFFPQYLVMLNELVEDWFDRGLRIPYAQVIGERRLGLPTVRLECDFTAPSRMGESLVQRLAVRHVGRSSLVLALEMEGGGVPRLAARQVLVCTSLATQRPQPLPDDVRGAVARYLEPA